MALLNILHYPDERLHKMALDVSKIDEQLHLLIKDMTETMYAAHGIGLAATQVNIQKRIIVIDLSENKDEPQVFINPEIIKQDGEIIHEEGCLSVPGIYELVTRSQTITLRALDLNLQQFEIEADDLFAICLQHEIDHLNGKLFVQHLSQLKQNRIKNKIKKQEKIRLQELKTKHN